MLLIIYIFPAATYLDWGLTQINITKSNNFFRAFSGIFLGLAAATMVYSVIKNPLIIHPYISVIFYLIVAYIVLKSKA